MCVYYGIRILLDVVKRKRRLFFVFNFIIYCCSYYDFMNVEMIMIVFGMLDV